MIQSVEEFRAELERGVFPQAAHAGPLADCEVPVGLRRSKQDVAPGVAESGGASNAVDRADRGHRADRAPVEETAQPRFDTARTQKVVIGQAWANLRARSSRISVSDGAARIGKRHGQPALNRDEPGYAPAR